MSIARFSKRLIGKGLLSISELVPGAKPWLRRWGIRTTPTWFGERIVKVQLPQGGRLKLASFSQDYLSFVLFWRGAAFYEPVPLLLARSLARAGDTFLEVGAHIGFYASVLALHEPQLRVIAFEPNPFNFRLLRQNIQANAFEQVRCEPLALSDADGAAILYLRGTELNGFHEHRWESAATVKVPTITLDSYLARCYLPGRLLIRLNLEGEEASFFQGARQTLASRRPEILAKVNRPLGSPVLGELRHAGYFFYLITGQGLHEMETVGEVVRGRFRFVNWLFSGRPRRQVAAMFESLRPQVQRIDLSRTSECLDLVPPPSWASGGTRFHPVSKVPTQTLEPRSEKRVRGQRFGSTKPP